MKFLRFDYILGAVLVGLLVLIIAGAVHNAHINSTDNEHTRGLFNAWTKLHPDTPLSFEEWMRLKQAKLLGNHGD